MNANIAGIMMTDIVNGAIGEDIIAPLRRILQRSDSNWLAALWDRSQYGGVPAGPPPEALRALLGEEEQVVDDLFFRGDASSEASARRVVGDACIDYFLRIGLLTRQGDAVCSTGLRIRPRVGYALLTGRITHDDGTPDTVLHLGVDSILCAEMITFLPRVRRAADLCAGSGILALCLARIANQVDAVELEPAVAQVARINIALAGLSDRVRVCQGDLFAPLAGQRFDVIVSNPPFVPSTDDYASDRVGAAGIDGLDIVRAVWAGAPDHLTENGRLYVVTGMLGDENGPFAEEEMRRLAHDNGWQASFLDLQEPMPIERFWFPSAMPEPRSWRIRQNQEAARQLGASHHFTGLFVAGPAPRWGYLRVPLCELRSRQMREAVRELREIRRGRA